MTISAFRSRYFGVYLSAALSLLVLLLIHDDRAYAKDGRMIWMFTSSAFQSIKENGDVKRFFENTDNQTMVVRRIADQDGGNLNAGVTWIRSFPSYRSMKHAVSSGTIEKGVRVLLYDNEGWEFTPKKEQDDPSRYMRMAADLAHAHGYRFISAPAVTLLKKSQTVGMRKYDAYLRYRLAAEAARYADIYEIQAQGSERNISRYAEFVHNAAAQAREANPRILVLAGISTNPSGQRVDADVLAKAVRSVRSFVNGYWMNIPRSNAYAPRVREYRPDIAVDLFRHLLSERE